MPKKLAMFALLIFGCGCGTLGWSLLGNQTGLVWAGFGMAALTSLSLHYMETKYYFLKIAYFIAAVLLLIIAVGVFGGWFLSNSTLK